MSDYVPRARSNPARGDANSAKYRKTTHPRKRREGWGTRQFKSPQTWTPSKIFSRFKGWRTWSGLNHVLIEGLIRSIHF
jgi:hypothetical protein